MHANDTNEYEYKCEKCPPSCLSRKRCYDKNMKKREFTAVYKKRGERYIAWIEEIPGVNTQGHTLRETKENLEDALRLVLNVRRSLGVRKNTPGIRREPLSITLPA